MPVILLGALKGMENTGLGYRIFMEWLVANSDIPKTLAERESQADSS